MLAKLFGPEIPDTSLRGLLRLRRQVLRGHRPALASARKLFGTEFSSREIVEILSDTLDNLRADWIELPIRDARYEARLRHRTLVLVPRIPTEAPATHIFPDRPTIGHATEVARELLNSKF